MHVFNVFYKSEKKHVFYVFYLQINFFNIYGDNDSDIDDDDDKEEDVDDDADNGRVSPSLIIIIKLTHIAEKNLLKSASEVVDRFMNATRGYIPSCPSTSPAAPT